ncbi:radial spoke head 14 homolog [Mugil cephalus]|uniref:radial spoke head 14 homolog n=1 Tax=Mugil cephalus TaxID=48193 RepID=UPI001FB57FDE|nr:radial spoke head 14 homolog [Mugil cephalus]
MAAVLVDPSRAPVAFGRRGVPQLFEELQHHPDSGRRLRALASLCDLVHDPDRLYQTVNGGFLQQLQVLLKDENPPVRAKTCEFLQLVSDHSIGRQALLASSLLPPLSLLLDDSSSSCRRNVLRVLNRLALLPSGAESLLSLVPKLILKLRQQEEQEEEEEEEEEVQVLLLSTVSCCSRLDPLPALASDAVSLLGHKLSHRCPSVRREAAGGLMELSVSLEGKQQVCEQQLLRVLVSLLQDQDQDSEVQTNAAGVLMNASIITTGKQQCLDLNVVPVLLQLLEEEEEEGGGEEERRRRRRRKALVLYSLRALTALAEAPDGRRLLLEHLPVLVRRSEAPEEDGDVRRAAQTAVRVVTWTP